MKGKHLLLICGVAVAALAAHAENIPYQSCSYSITADCVFIHATAAHATISFSCYDDTFNVVLGGSSVPIFDKTFCVNDTVVARFEPAGVTTRPATERVHYMAGFYRKPHVGQPMYSSNPDTYCSLAGTGYLSADHSTMECVQLTADMLCMFYYAKTVDFSAMTPGESQYTSMIMPDGTTKTLLTEYHGVTERDGRSVYNLTANFTYGGGFSAYPITVMIDTELKVPVEFAANIDIGRVVMSYEY